MSVVQRFANTGGQFSEAVYVLPLPDDAAVDRLTMKVGDRVVEGEIHEREQAEHVYSAARAAGQHASLVRQNTPNLFTTAIANIAPGEAIEITIEYLQTARFDNGEFSLRVPMTYTERYGVDTQAEPAGFDALADAGLTRGANSAFAASAVSSTITQARVAGYSARPVSAGTGDAGDAARSAPPLEASIHVALAPGFPLVDVVTRGHDSRVDVGRDVYRIETVTPRVPMDHDLVIAWRPVVGPKPTVAALSETVGDTTYALLMLLPPQNSLGWRTQPRELICVVDTSGSMAGQSISQAKTALANALDRLTSADRFNVIQFNSWTSQLYPESVPLTTETRAQALKWVAGLQANGGTEMEPALRAALEPPAPQGYLRQVIFMTDGGVADETRLFRVDQERPARRAPVHDRHRLRAELVLHAQGGAVRPRHVHLRRQHGGRRGLDARAVREARARGADRRARRLAGGRGALSAAGTRPVRGRAADRRGELRRRATASRWN